MKVVFLEPVSSLDGSYAAKETHDLPELLARQWAALGYCRISEEPIATDQVVAAAPAARRQRSKSLRNSTPDVDLL